MRQLNLQLYGRTVKKDFSEQLSTRETVTLTPNRVTIELPLRAPGHEKFVALRFDPDDKPSTFLLHRLAVKRDNGAEVFRWNGAPEALGQLTDMRAWNVNNEVLVQAQSNDPFLLIPLVEPQAGTLVLELSVSQDLSAPFIQDPETALGALSIHQQDLADAVRSLQYVVRLALDDLAADGEGLQDALVTHHAHARAENRSIAEHLSQILDRTDGLEAMLQTSATTLSQILDRTDGFESMLQSSTATLEESTKVTRSAILAEIRDDWRSLRRQLENSARIASKEASERDMALSATRAEEFAKLTAAIRCFTKSHDVMKQVRAELGIFRDEDAIPKLKQLKTETQDSRDQIAQFENSWLWRLARPFAARRWHRPPTS